jgi:hypothetical protein
MLGIGNSELAITLDVCAGVLDPLQMERQSFGSPNTLRLHPMATQRRSRKTLNLDANEAKFFRTTCASQRNSTLLRRLPLVPTCRINLLRIKAVRYADRSAGPARRACGTSGTDPPDTRRKTICCRAAILTDLECTIALTMLPCAMLK